MVILWVCAGALSHAHGWGARVRLGQGLGGVGGAGRSLGVASSKGVCRLSLQPQSRRGSAVQGWEKGGAGRCRAGKRWSWARPLAL